VIQNANPQRCGVPTPPLRFGGRNRRWLAVALFALLGLAGGLTAQQERRIYVPEDDVGIASLPQRAQEQEMVAARSDVRLGFELSDRLPASGITFVHHVVEDAGRLYKAAHYDHGNGIAVADIDNDGLADLYFANQVGANELWRNLGGGRFENITDTAGVGLAAAISVGASFADTDNDGDADLYVTTANQGNALFENLGDGRFGDISPFCGLDHAGHSSGAVFFDYNRDGLVDLYLANVGRYTMPEVGLGGYFLAFEDAFSGHLIPERTEPSILFENRGGNRFVDVSRERRLVDVGWSGDAAFADLNEDGFPDLYVPNMQGDDHYYENVEGLYFEEKRAELFPESPWGTMGIKFFDYDNDLRLDLLLTDMHSDMSEDIGPEREALKSRMQWTEEHLQGGGDNIFGNALWRNRGNDQFVEVSDAVGVESYWPWGVSVGDLNADGYEDVFITSSMNFPFRYQPNSLLINVGGEAFIDVAFVVGVEPRRDGRTHVPWFEIDCSGAEREHLACDGKQGVYTVMGTLGSRSSAFVDIDNDGDLDLVTNEFGSEPQLLISDLTERQEIHYLAVKLSGRRSNRDALGAQVTVYAGDDAYTRYHDGKSGYLSQSSQPLYFGLGDHQQVDRIEVRWPSGQTQTVEPPILLNRQLEIVETTGAVGSDERRPE